jgi:chemotaxis protein CheD
MLPALIKEESENIGQRNLKLGQELLEKYGFHIQATHLGGIGYRRVIFDIGSGQVWVYHHLTAGQKFGSLI